MTKTEKLLTLAATQTGAPMGLYINEANALIAAGKLERRIVFSKAGGNPKVRLFIGEAA